LDAKILTDKLQESVAPASRTPFAHLFSVLVVSTIAGAANRLDVLEGRCPARGIAADVAALKFGVRVFAIRYNTSTAAGFDE
jgi:hypothetical protein